MIRRRSKPGVFWGLVLWGPVALWALPLIPAQFNVNPDMVGVVMAAEEQKKKKRKKTRRVPAMRETTYKKLSEAQIMIDPESVPREEDEPAPEPTGTPREAVDMLLKLKDRKGLNSYELAQIWNTLAFAYYTLDDLPNTIRSYENILGQGVITEALELSSLRALYQLYYAESQYNKALEYIGRWEILKGTPDPQITYVKATIYYQLENFGKSLEYALLVEEIAISQQRTMRENWWYLQVVLYNQVENVDKVIAVLEKLIQHYPKKQYWMHLAGMYSEKNQEDRSLSAFYAAYIQGFLQKESEIVMLSQRLLNAETPYEASQVLTRGFEEGIVEGSEKNYRLLAMAYTMSQEKEKAIDAWREATGYAEDGELYYYLAQALANEDRHKEAIDAYRNAIKLGDLKSAADVYFWQGISQLQLERWDTATRSFRESSRLDKKKEKQARQYIRYISGERRRQEELRKMLEG